VPPGKEWNNAPLLAQPPQRNAHHRRPTRRARTHTRPPAGPGRKHFPQLSITFHGQTTTFTDVTIISSVRGGSTDSPKETVTFGFGALQIPYSPSPSPKPETLHQPLLNPAVIPTKKP